jgi:hypothetical protein
MKKGVTLAGAPLCTLPLTLTQTGPVFQPKDMGRPFRTGPFVRFP